MPELPEVEFVARQLRAELVGRTIVGIDIQWPGAVEGLGPDTFASRVVGQRVRAVGRRGKYVLLTLSGGDVLAIHRRMSGNLVFQKACEQVPYTRASFALDDGRHLAFSDPRKFGRLRLVAPDDRPTVLDTLGPEPLDDDFLPEALGARLAGRTRAIKALLLDQTAVAGLGNIYADEALYRGGIHPLRPAGSLTPAEVAALHAAIRQVLLTGIANGGTTFGRHRDVYNEAGTNVGYLEVYRRGGQPCRRCGTALRRMVVAQRGTHFCPVCQPLTGRSEG
jgi:formamidopyrimidine-DNA glycosylase